MCESAPCHTGHSSVLGPPSLPSHSLACGTGLLRPGKVGLALLGRVRTCWGQCGQRRVPLGMRARPFLALRGSVSDPMATSSHVGLMAAAGAVKAALGFSV